MLASGRYKLRITACKIRERTMGFGPPSLHFTAAVENGPEAGHLIRFMYSTVLHGVVLLRFLVEACGMKELLLARHDGMLETEEFVGRVFVADVSSCGGMGLPPGIPFVKPAILSSRELHREFRKMRERKEQGTGPVKISADLAASKLTWPQPQSGTRWDSSQPNVANGPRASGYCQCAKPAVKHVVFDTFQFDKCETCGKEIKA